MIRYKVTAYGGMRGLQFPDLVIRYSSGYSVPLEVHQDEYIPLEILDSLDVKKSLIAGSLGKYIANGKVVVVGDELPKIKFEIPKPAIPKEPIEQPTVEEKKEEPSKTPDPKVEPPKIIEPQITRLSDVKELKDFDRLSFYLKKRFLRETKDKALLLQIYQTTDSDSFKLHVKQRLKNF